MTVRVHWDVECEESLEDGIAKAVEAALLRGGRPEHAVDVIVVSDETLAGLHGRFLGDDTVTDVLSFDLADEEDGPQGEIYVSIERARSIAGQRNLPLARELALYSIHGALHLCGFDDHDDIDRQKMREVEAEVLDGLGYTRDERPHDLDA